MAEQVIWGTTDRTDEKALKLGALLTQPGTHLRRVQPGSADGQVGRFASKHAENPAACLGAPARIPRTLALPFCLRETT